MAVCTSERGAYEPVERQHQRVEAKAELFALGLNLSKVPLGPVAFAFPGPPVSLMAYDQIRAQLRYPARRGAVGVLSVP